MNALTLAHQFDDLAAVTGRLISLLAEADERFWRRQLERALPLVRAHKLAGATHLLGCFGGANTFSDLVIGESLQDTDPLRFKNLNARLKADRDALFAAANRITSRESW